MNVILAILLAVLSFTSSYSEILKGKLDLSNAAVPKISPPSVKPVVSLPKKSKQSSIEKNFSRRALVPLRQFGYEFFKRKVSVPQVAPVSKDYVLGPGDQLFLYVIGVPPGVELSKVNTLVVDREGKVYIPGIGIFHVCGMTLKEAEEVISSAINANIKLTVGKLRTFPVYVSGEVENPGVVYLTSLNTVVDAISLAGGIKKTGSLRNVWLIRKNGKKVRKKVIDFYRLLLYGEPIDVRVKDGDVILVKPIGKVVGISGAVKRPGIYELKDEKTVKEVLELAGGLLPSGYEPVVTIQRFKEGKKLEVISGSLKDEKFLESPVVDGDIIAVRSISSVPENAIQLKGYTPHPGIYAYKPGMKLSDLLKPEVFYPDTNMKFGVIERVYPFGEFPKFLTFMPEEVLKGVEDIELKPMDKVYLYRFGDTKSVDLNKVKNAVVVEGRIKYPGIYAYKPGMKLSDLLKPEMLLLDTNTDIAEVERRNPKTLEVEEIIKFSPSKVIKQEEDLVLKPLDVVRFYPRYAFKPIEVSGEVVGPYYVPYRDGIKLSEVLSSARFTTDVSKLKAIVYGNCPKVTSLELEEEKGIEKLAKVEKGEEKALKEKKKLQVKLAKQKVCTFSVFLYDLLVKGDLEADIPLAPGSKVLVVPVRGKEIVKKVYVGGRVKNPGYIKLKKGMTLYDALKIAGGFAEDAYPEGIIILRESVKKAQKERLLKAIAVLKQELEKEKAGIMQAELTPEELKARQVAFEAKEKLLEEMEKVQVTGRISGIVVPKDLEKLRNSPYNIKLEDGDFIYVPKRPDSVLVFGEVFNPTAYIYIPGYKVKDYIKLAGGLTKDADRENIFVIKADGSAVSGKGTSLIWGFPKSNRILKFALSPGDAVIVPTKIKVPIMWRPLIKDVVQILYQSALVVYTISKL